LHNLGANVVSLQRYRDRELKESLRFVRDARDARGAREDRETGVEARGAGVEARGAGVEAGGAAVEARGAAVEARGAAVEGRGAGVGARSQTDVPYSGSLRTLDDLLIPSSSQRPVSPQGSATGSDAHESDSSSGSSLRDRLKRALQKTQDELGGEEMVYSLQQLVEWSDRFSGLPSVVDDVPEAGVDAGFDTRRPSRSAPDRQASARPTLAGSSHAPHQVGIAEKTPTPSDLSSLALAGRDEPDDDAEQVQEGTRTEADEIPEMRLAQLHLWQSQLGALANRGVQPLMTTAEIRERELTRRQQLQDAHVQGRFRRRLEERYERTLLEREYESDENMDSTSSASASSSGMKGVTEQDPQSGL
jgi:hypothetical protein